MHSLQVNGMINDFRGSTETEKDECDCSMLFSSIQQIHFEYLEGPSLLSEIVCRLTSWSP